MSSSVDVQLFGAKGDGVTDDTASFQRAIDASIKSNAKLIISSPQVGKYYVIKNTLKLMPLNGSSFHLDIECEDNFDGIRWRGPDNTSIFYSKGWKRSHITNLKVRLNQANSGVVVFDIDGDSVEHNSSSHLTFDNCHITLNSAPKDCTGWRIGHGAGDAVDFSYIMWENCTMFSDELNGHTGWRVEGANALQFQWFGGGGSKLDTAFTNVPSLGAAGSGGGPTMYFYGFGNSGCKLDFRFRTSGSYAVFGGRFELGQRFIDIGDSNSQAGTNVHVSSAVVASYSPIDGIVFNVGGGSSLLLDAVEARPQINAPDFTAAVITLSAPAEARGSLIARGCAIRATEPFYTDKTNGASFAIQVEGCRHINSTFKTTSMFKRCAIEPA